MAYTVVDTITISAATVGAPPVEGIIDTVMYWSGANWVTLWDQFGAVNPPLLTLGDDLILAVMWANTGGVNARANVDLTVTSPSGVTTTPPGSGQGQQKPPGSGQTVQFAGVSLNEVGTYTGSIVLSMESAV